jgi:hypothetical protein
VRIHEALHTALVAALTRGARAGIGGDGRPQQDDARQRMRPALLAAQPTDPVVYAGAGLESGFALLFQNLFPGRSDAGHPFAGRTVPRYHVWLCRDRLCHRWRRRILARTARS